MIRVVEAGIDLMEHAEFLDPDNQLRFDSDLAEKMAESGIWISPTLQAWTNYPCIVALTQRREEGQFSAGGRAGVGLLRASYGTSAGHHAKDA